jgi:hypothetical protein
MKVFFILFHCTLSAICVPAIINYPGNYWLVITASVGFLSNLVFAIQTTK